MLTFQGYMVLIFQEDPRISLLKTWMWPSYIALANNNAFQKKFLQVQE